MAGQLVCEIRDTSDVGAARRSAQRVAENFGFGAVDAGRVAIIATELANNLVRHAQGGRLYVQEIHEPGLPSIEILSVDLGPGMDNVEQCMRDGYSTGGTPGTGLGAVKRASSEFDVFTEPGKGCVLLSRVRATAIALTGASVSPPKWRWGAMTTPYPGETAIGDCWRIVSRGDDVSVMIADGLGHGPLASEASEGAAGVFEAQPFGMLKPFLEKAHGVLRSTRGAAVAAAVCPGETGVLRYAGIGNIAGSILDRNGNSRGLMSHNGTVGAGMRTVHEISYDWTVGDKLVMHSDGLTSRWSLAGYPRLLTHHPALIGAILLRDFARGRDDATVVVVERLT